MHWSTLRSRPACIHGRGGGKFEVFPFFSPRFFAKQHFYVSFSILRGLKWPPIKKRNSISSHFLPFLLISSHFLPFPLNSSHFLPFPLISSLFISFPPISSHFLSLPLISSHFLPFPLISSHCLPKSDGQNWPDEIAEMARQKIFGWVAAPLAPPRVCGCI